MLPVVTRIYQPQNGHQGSAIAGYIGLMEKIPKMKHFWARAYPDEVRKINLLIEAPVASAEELRKRLREVHQLILADTMAQYEINGLRADAVAIMQEIFRFRMGLRDKIAGWHGQGYVNHDVQLALRGILRDARYATDMMGELAANFAQLAEGEEALQGFTGDQHNTLVHQRFAEGAQGIEFRSGDVVLVRGRHHNSAAIARIGDVDSQFSHVGMVYVDQQGKNWMVEALIASGAVVKPLEESLRDGISRAVLLRHKDSELAARAAEFIHDRVLKSRRLFRRHIPYDFTMRLDGYKELFCAKLVRQAFDQASDGQVKLPQFKTLLDMQNRDFLDRIGVQALQTFAPADIEIEPDFDIVAEWRDFRVTSDSRLQDLLMDKLFEWMENYDYRFEPDFTIHLISFFGRLSSYLSATAKEMIKDVVPKVPRNMSAKSIGAVAMLHRTAQPVFLSLKLQERESIRTAGHPLHQNELRQRLEFVRNNSPGRIGHLVSSLPTEQHGSDPC